MLKIFALRGGIMMTIKTQADSYTHQFHSIFRIAYRRYEVARQDFLCQVGGWGNAGNKAQLSPAKLGFGLSLAIMSKSLQLLSDQISK